MTQPCHKNTALNQQCCNSEHKDGREKERNTTFTTKPHTPHTPPSRSPYTTQQHKEKAGQHDTRECNARRTRQCGMPDLPRRQGTPRRGQGDNTRQGTTRHTHPRHSTGPPSKRKGDTNSRREGTLTFEGEPITLPPFTHHATPPHHATHHPTIAPPTTTTRGRVIGGYPTTQRPPRHTHHPHTTHPATRQ